MRDGSVNSPELASEPPAGESGRTRQWYISGKPSYWFPRAQLVVMVCTASSRQAPNPADPTPY
jgi:hypothetical protein